jgi:uncharacterized membrane protein required for colicin V production
MSLILDILFILIIAGAAYQGYKDGFIKAVSSLLSTVVALYGAGLFYLTGAEWLSDLTGWRLGFCRVVVFIILLILINRLIVFIMYLLDRALRFVAGLPIIRTINRGLGAFCRGLEGIILLFLLIILLERFSRGMVAGWLEASYIARSIVRFVGYIWPFVAKISRNMP